MRDWESERLREWEIERVSENASVRVCESERDERRGRLDREKGFHRN